LTTPITDYLPRLAAAFADAGQRQPITERAIQMAGAALSPLWITPGPVLRPEDERCCLRRVRLAPGESASPDSGLGRPECYNPPVLTIGR
jgi:hypothetical protein